MGFLYRIKIKSGETPIKSQRVPTIGLNTGKHRDAFGALQNCVAPEIGFSRADSQERYRNIRAVHTS